MPKIVTNTLSRLMYYPPALKSLLALPEVQYAFDAKLHYGGYNTPYDGCFALFSVDKSSLVFQYAKKLIQALPDGRYAIFAKNGFYSRFQSDTKVLNHTSGVKRRAICRL